MGKGGKVTGVLYSKDLLTAPKGSIKKILRDPYFVSESDEVTTIFDLMKKKRIHIAIVKNQNGINVGVVTLEDMIEELVGEIHDEYYDRKFSQIPKPAAA
jgi:CBS domain containing-hemolysin-like protein